jgi:hypothetical protein
MQNVNELHNRIIRDAEYITNEMLPFVLMCIMPQVVLRSTEHTGNYVRSSASQCISPKYFVTEGM